MNENEVKTSTQIDKINLKLIAMQSSAEILGNLFPTCDINCVQTDSIGCLFDLFYYALGSVVNEFEALSDSLCEKGD